MAIVQDVITSLLNMISIEELSDGPPALEKDIIALLQQAQGQIADLNPSYFYSNKNGEGIVARPPSVISIEVWEFSNATTITGWETWMAGCTIIIEGDSRPNRLQNATASGSSKTLQRPYMGTPGVKTATVYSDFLLLPENIRAVQDPVKFGAVTLFKQTYDRLSQFPSAAGTPTAWTDLAITRIGRARAGILLNSYPTTAELVTFSARVGYDPIVSVTDTRTEVIPQGRDLEIFLPFCRWLMAAYPGCSIPQQDLQLPYENAKNAAQTLRTSGPRRKIMQYPGMR